MRLRDQAAALALLRTDPALDGLTTLTAPLVDREVHKLAWPSLLLFTDQQTQPLSHLHLSTAVDVVATPCVPCPLHLYFCYAVPPATLACSCPACSV
jgi:hypothetical protein